MQLYETFEVKFKDNDSPQQRKMLLQALKDLYLNLDKYHIVKRNDSNDQTSKFMEKFYITKNDIATLLEDYAFSLQVSEWTIFLMIEIDLTIFYIFCIFLMLK